MVGLEEEERLSTMGGTLHELGRQCWGMPL